MKWREKRQRVNDAMNFTVSESWGKSIVHEMGQFVGIFTARETPPNDWTIANPGRNIRRIRIPQIRQFIGGLGPAKFISIRRKNVWRK